MQNNISPESQPAVAAQPARSLSWYDYLWSAMPLALLYTGGAMGIAGNILGGLVGVLGVLLNLRILRGKRNIVLRYLLSFLATAGAFIVFAILITLFQALTQKP